MTKKQCLSRVARSRKSRASSSGSMTIFTGGDKIEEVTEAPVVQTRARLSRRRGERERRQSQSAPPRSRVFFPAGKKK